MSQDEAGTLRALGAHREVMDRLITDHRGRIANTAGDSVLAEFPSAVDAVQCAIEIQEKLASGNAGPPEDRHLQFRIGIHVGDVVVRGADLLGDGVNIAARLESLAEPGGICVSEAAHAHVRKVLPLAYTDLGEQHLKNMDEPVRAYAISATVASASKRQPLPLPNKPSIAVLPFTNMSGDPEQDYFCDGLVEDIITALSRFRALFVIARTSSFTYKGRAVDVRQVGRELGVRYILEGSVRKAGGRIRITGQLIEAETGAHIWANRYDGSEVDVFELQDSVAESVVGAIEPSVRIAEVSRARAKPTASLDAYDLYLRALPLHYSNDREKLAEAQRLLDRAIEIDPSYAVAKGFAALTTVIQANQGWASEADRQRGVRLARQALADIQDDPVVLRCIGHALAYLDRDYNLAVALLDRALALNLNSAEVHHSAGWVWNFAGNGLKASEHFKRAIRLSPVDPEIGHTLMGLTFSELLMEEYDEALQVSLRAMAVMPSSLSPLRAAIVSLVELGRLHEAQSLGRKILSLNPSFRVDAFRAGQPFQNGKFVERYMSALMAAGLPE